MFPSPSAHIGNCPLCSGSLTLESVRPGPFDCPNCLKRIMPVRRPTYLWLRTLLCGVVAVTAARLHGFEWSFLIFVVALYAIPVLLLWDGIIFRLIPPTKFQAVPS